MADTPLRNRSIRQISMTVAVMAVMAGLALLIYGMIYLIGESTGPNGVLGLASGLLLIGFGIISHSIVVLLSKAEITLSRMSGHTYDLSESVNRLEPVVRNIADNSEISDAARSITHRDKETEALRHAIREEMYRSNWDAAIYLVEQLERRFGYAREAEELRKEMAQFREMTIEEKLGQAMARIDKMLDDHLWARAVQESERLLKLFPKTERVLQLPAHIARRREARKQELLKEWHAAVEREETEKGIAILTELDQFLTRAEAQQLQDSARHVFKARLVNLGVQFTLAASEQRWRDALEIGLTLRGEFPNSRMAQEVGEKLEILRARAGFTNNAEVVQQKSNSG